MRRKRGRRLVTGLGVAAVTGLVVVGTDHAVARMTPHVPPSVDGWTLLTTVLALVLVLWPLYAVGPSRSVVRAKRIGRRVVATVAVLGLGGYLGATFVPDPVTLTLSGTTLALVLPLGFALRRRRADGGRVLVVGDDRRLIEDAIRSLPDRPVGFLSPVLHDRSTGRRRTEGTGARARDRARAVSDGRGRSLPDGGESRPRVESIRGAARIGGLSRLERAVCGADADAVALAFREADRGEFFGVLGKNHELGLEVLVHEELQEEVLVADDGPGALVEVDVEPWPWHSRLLKRAFDLAFAAVGLVVLAPVAVAIAIAIRIDSPGPVLFWQQRTSEFGGTFEVPKFRSMQPESENAEPEDDEDNDRITRVGGVLRRTNLDEIPQLCSVVLGDLSVVGPRAAWVAEDSLLYSTVEGWPKRWHVKPGMTGLAQIRGATSTEGDRKLALDVEYVRNRSFGYDCRIVLAQIRLVVLDVVTIVARRAPWRSSERGATTNRGDDR